MYRKGKGIRKKRHRGNQLISTQLLLSLFLLPPVSNSREGIFKLLRIPESIPRNRFCQPMQTGGPNPLPTRFLAPIDCSKIPALSFEIYWQKLLAGKQQENSQIFNEDFYLPLYLPLCVSRTMSTFFTNILQGLCLCRAVVSVFTTKVCPIMRK